MAKKKVTRKLAAILATDMVGFSRLMEKDEAGTLARQKAHRKRLIDPKIAKHNGRIVKSTGDGLLVEFASAVDAVQCAVEVQRAMSKLEADVPEERRIAYRVGVNVGDIIVEDEDIFGDGVNIAARLEALAEPGGICVSRNVFDQVKNKVELGFVDLGPQKVKNIAEPVPTYKVLLDPAEAGTVVAAKRTVPTRLRWVASAAAAVLLLVLASMAWWQPWVTRVEPARLAKMAFPLPKKPSIAVLPFDNLSGDKTQEYLADGLSENIIQALSKVSEMFVIARNSTFTYKGKPVKVQRVAEELGVRYVLEGSVQKSGDRYVLEGSVQKSGDRIRVTAQLIDAISGHHLWSERYDRKLTDLFAVQDEITQNIVGALEIKLTEREVTRARRGATSNVKAWEITRRGIRVFRRITKEDNVRARRMAQKAIALDPRYVTAWNLLAYTHYYDARLRWSDDPAKSLARTEALAKKIVALDPRHPDNYHLLLQIHMLKGENDKAIAVGEEGVNLYPNHSINIALLAQALVFSGRAEEALALMHRAMRLSPHYPWYFLNFVGYAHHEIGRYGKAIEALRKSLARNPNAITTWVRIAAVYSEAGRADEARAAARRILNINPKFSVRAFAKALPYKDKVRLERVLAALRKAGLPE